MMVVFLILISLLFICVCIRCINRNVRESVRNIEILQLKQLIQNEKNEEVKLDYIKELEYKVNFKESLWIENLFGVTLFALALILVFLTFSMF